MEAGSQKDQQGGRRWQPCSEIVTNETNLMDHQIAAIYERRSFIELLFKELRQDLRLGKYQVQHEAAILNHLRLCCPAHLLLTHRSPRALGCQSQKAEQGSGSAVDEAAAARPARSRPLRSDPTGPAEGA